MQGQRRTFGSRARRVNKTGDLFLRDSYLIPCKPYPKGLPLSVPPPVLERAGVLPLQVSHVIMDLTGMIKLALKDGRVLPLSGKQKPN